MLSFKMRKVRHSSKRTQSKAKAEVLSAELGQLMVETPTVEDESRSLRSPVGLSQPGGGSRDSCGSDSDSRDSLFLTQKDVPAAERSRRRRPGKTPRPPEKNGRATSSFASPSKSPKQRKRTGFTMHLPKYSFLLHQVKSTRMVLSPTQNTKLNNAVIGGFFNSLRDLGEPDDRKEDLLSSLPTIDINGECILPISEEEETSENEDIKVVPNSHFVVPSKIKPPQPWYDPKGRDRWVKPQSNGGPETSRGGQREASEDIQTTGDGDSSLGVERKMQISNKPVLGKTSKVENKIIVHEEEKEDEICPDSDATVSDLNPKESPQKAGAALTEHQTDISQTNELSMSGEEEPGDQNLLPRDAYNDSVCSDSRVNTRREIGDHESVENGKSQGELVDEDSATSVTVGLTEKDETLNLNLSQTIDELERFSQNDGQKERDNPDLKQRKKKKRRKNRSGDENVGQEEDGVVECDVRVEVDSVIAGRCSEQDGGKKKKKKKKKRERHEEAEQLKSDEAPESLKDDIEIRKSKKKRRRESIMSLEQTEESRHCLENTGASLNTLDSGNAEGKQSPSNNGEVCAAVNNSDQVLSVAENPAVKKKKKKKKRTSESGDISHGPEEEESADKTQTTASPEDQDAQPTTKKKKKKKMIEASTLNICTDPATQSDESASVRKKTKHPSFLEADAVETEKLSDRGAGDSRSESAEISGSLSERDEVRKKKKKRKSAVVAEEMDVEEPNDLCQKEAAETVVKVKRKKQKLMTPIEVSEGAEYSQTDGDTKVKKKDIESVKSALSPKKKGLTVIAEVERDSQFSDGDQIQASNDVSGKKKKKKKKFTENISPEKKTFSGGTQADVTEVGFSVRSPVLKASPSLLETSSSHGVRKNKSSKIKRTLLNPSEDFFEPQCEPAN